MTYISNEWCDAVILEESSITEIYRIPGADITYHLEDVLLFLQTGSRGYFQKEEV